MGEHRGHAHFNVNSSRVLLPLKKGMEQESVYVVSCVQQYLLAPRPRRCSICIWGISVAWIDPLLETLSRIRATRVLFWPWFIIWPYFNFLCLFPTYYLLHDFSASCLPSHSSLSTGNFHLISTNQKTKAEVCLL